MESPPRPFVLSLGATAGLVDGDAWRAARETVMDRPAAPRAAAGGFPFGILPSLRRSVAWRISRHGAHVVPPSTGGRLPQRMHKPASIRSFWRRLLLARPLRRLASTLAPPYFSPAALPAAYFARSEARRCSRHGSQDERPSAAGALPQRVQMPSAWRAARSRRERSRSYSRARTGSRRGFPWARSLASRARLAWLRFSAHESQTERSGAGGTVPQRGHRPAALRAAVRLRNRSRSAARPTAGSA